MSRATRAIGRAFPGRRPAAILLVVHNASPPSAPGHGASNPRMIASPAGLTQVKLATNRVACPAESLVHE